MPQEKVYDDVEVHNVNDLHQTKRDVKVEGQGESPVIWKALSVVIAMAAVIYDLSPIDVVPDAIPIFGWLDDVGFTLMAALNAYQHFSKDQSALHVRLAKYVKWMMVALIILAGVAVGGLLTAIIALVTR
ncbi:YkvA family protein [Fibrobacter succinogenes]|jgi:Uncharacterized conserved protein|uniref:YkvA family protein n=1 Tax=Fibrobacter succinogenes TaxID=833 RepID=UPI00156A1BAE|nr:YkvA family protein [Fibrobacter succinogenes]